MPAGIADDDDAVGGVAAAVAPAQDRRALAHIAQPRRDQRRERCLRAPADREVADADDRTGQPAAQMRAARVVAAAETRGGGVDADEISGPPGTGARCRDRGGGSTRAMAVIVLPRAPRLASTSARAAAPSRARRTGSVSSPIKACSSSRAGPDLDRRVVLDERPRDLREVLHVGPEHDRLAEHGRLEDVVSALVDQAAADEDRGRDLVELRELADGVEHDDVLARLGVDRQIAAARGLPSGAPRELLHLGEALGLARRDDQQRVGDARADALERLEDRRLFTLERAGGDDHRAIVGDAEIAEHAVAPAVGGGRAFRADRANRTSGCRSRRPGRDPRRCR